MTNVGIHSGLYLRYSEFSDLLDRVILSVKGGASSPMDRDRKTLASVMARLGSSPAPNVFTKLLATLLRDEGETDMARWAAMGNALTSAGLTEEAVVRFDWLAQRMDRERSELLLRMRGRR